MSTRTRVLASVGIVLAAITVPPFVALYIAWLIPAVLGLPFDTAAKQSTMVTAYIVAAFCGVGGCVGVWIK